jgi:hypothetical protein
MQEFLGETIGNVSLRKPNRIAISADEFLASSFSRWPAPSLVPRPKPSGCQSDQASVCGTAIVVTGAPRFGPVGREFYRPTQSELIATWQSPTARIGAIRGQVLPRNDGRRAAEALQPIFQMIATAFGIGGREN